MAPQQILVNQSLRYALVRSSSVFMRGAGGRVAMCPQKALWPGEKFWMLISPFLPAHLEKFTPIRDGRSTQNREIAPADREPLLRRSYEGSLVRNVSVRNVDCESKSKNTHWLELILKKTKTKTKTKQNNNSNNNNNKHFVGPNLKTTSIIRIWENSFASLIWKRTVSLVRNCEGTALHSDRDSD